jgi:hypothetical protein
MSNIAHFQLVVCCAEAAMFTFVHFWPEPNPHFRLMSGGAVVVEWEPMVIGRDYFTRQATILLKFAKATKDQKVAASLIEKAADLNLQVDEQGARPDPSPLAPDVQPEK